MFYSMGIQIILLNVNNNFPTLDLMYFLDDGYLHGEVVETLAAFDFLKIEMEKVGQIFDVSKCLVFGNSLALAKFNHPDLQKSPDGLIILGCPYGTTQYMNRSLSLLLENLQIECNYLKSINNPLSAYNIFKYCLNTKGTYLARVCPPVLLCVYVITLLVLIVVLITLLLPGWT